ncbi:MAG TPA: hypothetical protein VGL81_13625 [Polyangiaceae bacterium]|jgi:hypothetical protein
MRAFWAGISVVAVVLAATPAPARERSPSRACRAAYEGAQESERSGHLREGRAQLLECAKASCGALQKKCASRAGQLASDIALIEPVVTDAGGAALLDAQVKVDGELLTSRLDGRPLAVDPGAHQLSVTARVGPWPGREVSTTQAITIEQGQRGPIAIALPPLDDGALATAPDLTGDAGTSAAASKTPAPANPEHEPAVTVRHHGPSAFAYLLGGVGLLGVGAGGLLTYWGKTDNTALAGCAPNCAPASVAHIRELYLASDVSLAAGGAMLGLAALLFSTTSHVEVQPVHSGALASFRGAF